MNAEQPPENYFETESFVYTAKNKTPSLNIFLSSTSSDLVDYRRKVKEHLSRFKIICNLSEDWVNSWSSTLQKCHEEISSANGYIGIFAYWYGSIPHNFEQSVTHWEFQQAKKNLDENEHPPIAVFMPHPLSNAAKLLKKRASTLIFEKYNDRQEEHESLINKFHGDVRDSWKTVNHFKDREDLCVQIVIICMRWGGLSLIEASRGDVGIKRKNTATRIVTYEELALLGRKNQLDSLEAILKRVTHYRSVPAVAVIVSGNEDAEQKLFLQYIVRAKKIKGRKPEIGRPPSEQYDLDTLIQWAADSLNLLSDGNAVNSIEDLAASINARLHTEQLCLILDEIHRYLGGVKTLYEKFWQPLFSELEKLKIKNQTPHRLIAIFVDYTSESENWTSVTTKFDDEQTDATNYAKMFLIQLTNISGKHLHEWFYDLEIPESVPGRLEKLANAVLTSVSGKFDGTPHRVFRRLRNENLWNE